MEKKNNLIIETRDLTKYYGKKRAIEGLDLAVEEKSIYGFLGCNGAGKTTTLSIISGLVRKTRGSIVIDGKDFDKQEDEIKSVIGIMPQNMSTYGNKSAYANMMYYAMLKGIEKSEAIRQINSLFSELQVEEFRKIKTGKLSHGQEKLFLILQTFLGNPKIVILDEPISGFDPKKIMLLREFLKKKSKGCTILFSSHDLDEVDRLCTHIGIIHDGKLILQGKKEKVKNGKSLEKVFISNI